MKLNLGCGSKLWPGFVNVDVEAREEVRPDVVSDLRSLPFDDEAAEEAHAIHVIEHFYQWEAESVLREWKRVLKPGGLLVLELPCLDKVFKYIAYCMEKKEPMREDCTLWVMWGDPSWKSPGMCHKWGYTKTMLVDLLKTCGFVQIEPMQAQFHQPLRDMRVEARKPNAS